MFLSGLHLPSETARTGLVSSPELMSSYGCGELASPSKLPFSLGTVPIGLHSTQGAFYVEDE